MTSPTLELRSLSKSFGEVVVANELNLALGQAETLGIVGPNGAGKSTLFAMISGELAPDRGAVLLNGDDVTKVAFHKRTTQGIGRTFQIPRPFTGMTVFENVLVFATHGAQLRGSNAAHVAVETLERCGLVGRANKPAEALGLLDRKRLEVARALATQPAILLLDEVAGGLTDPEVAELVDLINSLKAERLTIIWIEHVVHALLATVDRLACLAGGRIVADGAPRDVLADPTVRELYLGQSPTLEEA